MSRNELLPFLNLGTLVVALVIIGAALFFFLRKRSNRHSMDGTPERNIAADLDADKPRSSNEPPHPSA